MLELKNIKKQYKMQDEVVHALKGINVKFRETEFVSILGQSGCGKTTLLNIVGGLDKYTSGDLIINGISTKNYTSKDWDIYRNHKIGFIFQSYNLIPHLSVLENVELALTLSGIGKDERRKRAEEVLKKVGLGSKLKNKPNQLSGGQMQRVAIARALVNDPDIILADEPTGALDSKTSVQIMDLLKEISSEKLIIMVTHNPELAQQYSSRIIKLLDGNIIEDSNPFDGVGKEDYLKDKKDEKIKKTKEKTKMSFFTALSLSFKNLLTKKARTFLVSFAGSIGIIGIALILALSSGFQTYVNAVQKDTLSSYPVQLTNSSYDMASLMTIFFDNKEIDSSSINLEEITTKNELTEMLSKFNMSSSSNDLKSFKSYIESDGKEELEKYVSAIQYVYDVDINAYYKDSLNNLINTNQSTVFSDVINSYPTSKLDTKDKAVRYGLLSYMFGSESSYYSNDFWSEMIDNQELLQSQYELIGNSKWATEYNEVMLVVDKNNQISDYTLYGLGLLNQSDLELLLDNYINNKDADAVSTKYNYSDLLNISYKLILNTDYYENESNEFLDIRRYNTKDDCLFNQELYKTKLQQLYDNKGIELKIVGIIKEKEDANATSLSTPIVYNSKLTQYIIKQIENSELVQYIKNNSTTVFKEYDSTNDATLAKTYQQEDALTNVGYTTTDNPEGIYLYPKDFEAKEDISNFITRYNDKVKEQGEENKVITYTDTIGVMMSSISTIISAVSYVLIAFVSISLIVSSIMIGIITYISVLERIKEIGVLRSIGASKQDIKNVFVSESVIIGLIAGILGILVTLILTIPINIVINSLAGLSNIASLPFGGGVALIIISVFLTFIAGLIPARIASKKDPVIALRNE